MSLHCILACIKVAIYYLLIIKKLMFGKSFAALLLAAAQVEGHSYNTTTTVDDYMTTDPGYTATAEPAAYTGTDVPSYTGTYEPTYTTADDVYTVATTDFVVDWTTTTEAYGEALSDTFDSYGRYYSLL